ncbi:hypothetical protein ACEUZ9_000300 [Paracoccus litorisediminis]|uniref:hypothetical protein n=1 Tax=Paracoccus litorisediminis TaxID=2006130 RepID=UPI003732FD8A
MPQFRVFHIHLPPGAIITPDLSEDMFQAGWRGNVDGVLARGLYREVAKLEVFDIEEVFPKTNHLHPAGWQANEGVIRAIDHARSTSVGDLALDEAGALHICAQIGWERASQDQLALFNEKLGGEIAEISDDTPILGGF